VTLIVTLRSCGCSRRSQGRGQGQSEGQTCSASKPSEGRGAVLAGVVVRKPWARTLRDYGSSDKSPSPVSSRRSTPDSYSTAGNCSRSSTASRSKTGSDVIGGGRQDLPAKRRPGPPRTKRPTPAADLGKTKSDSTLARRQLNRKITCSSAVNGASSIPSASSSLGAVTSRRVLVNSAVAGRSNGQTSTGRRTATTNATSTKQPDESCSKATTGADSKISCISNRQKIAVAASSSAKTESKTLESASSVVCSSHNAVKTVVDIYKFNDLGKVPSRAPAATSVQPEVFHQARAGRQPRLAGNDDVNDVTLLAEKKLVRQRSLASGVGSAGIGIGASSVINKFVMEKDVETAKGKSNHVTSVTSSKVRRDFDLDRRDLACDIDGKKKLATSNAGTSLLCSQQQQPKETLNTCITKVSSEGLFPQTNLDDVQDRNSSSDLKVFQHSQSKLNSVTVAHSAQSKNTRSNTYGKEHLVKTKENIQNENSSSNCLKNTDTDSAISATERRQKNRKVKGGGRQDKQIGKDNKRSMPPFDKVDIERDFEFMDEILSSTTAELYHFIRPPDCHISDGSSTRFPTIPIDTLLAQLNDCTTDSNSDSFGKTDCMTSKNVVYFSCPTSAAKVRPVRSRVAGLLFTTDSVVPASVIEVAKHLKQDQRLSSPKLSDYVAENRHRVEEVSTEQHQPQQHLADPSRRREDLALNYSSPSSDEIVPEASSSDTSTMCSLSSPSGSQDSSCRWKSPDDSTLGRSARRRSFAPSGHVRAGKVTEQCSDHLTIT